MNYRPRILSPPKAPAKKKKIALRNEGKANLRECVTSGLILKEWLKKFSNQKE